MNENSFSKKTERDIHKSVHWYRNFLFSFTRGLVIKLFFISDMLKLCWIHTISIRVTPWVTRVFSLQTFYYSYNNDCAWKFRWQHLKESTYTVHDHHSFCFCFFFLFSKIVITWNVEIETADIMYTNTIVLSSEWTDVIWGHHYSSPLYISRNQPQMQVKKTWLM